MATNGPQPLELVAETRSRAAGSVTKLVKTSENLLKPSAFNPNEKGFDRKGDTFVCDNGSDGKAARGIMQVVTLEQTKPEPIFAVVYSKAEGVTGPANSDYSINLELTYTDRSHLYAQFAPFSVGNHDWERREVYVMPEKPVLDVYYYCLFRKHGGKASFKGAELYTVEAPAGSRHVATNGPKPVELVESPSLAAARRIPPVTRLVKAGENLLSPYSFDPMGKGFEREREAFFCDNGDDLKAYRGVEQQVEIRQSKPEPLFAVGYSKAEGVRGLVNQEYSVFLDVEHTDGTFTYWQFSPFDVGTHDWQRREVYFMPKKPISVVWYHCVFRNHSGKAWFRLPELYKVRPPEGGAPGTIAPMVAVNGAEPVTLVDAGPGQAAVEAARPAGSEPRADAGTEEGVPRVAILDLADKGPSVELAPLRTAFAEMLAGDLAQYQGVRVVERIRVDQFLREANLQRGFVDNAARERAAQALAADYVLSGSFEGKSGRVAIEVSLSKTGETKASLEWRQSATVEKMGELERELVPKVLGALGISKPVLRPAPRAKPGPSPLVAVLALRNLSPSARLEAMQDGFADILQANLGAINDVRLVERERLHAVLKEQNLSLSGLADPATAIKVGQLLGAERLVYGSFVELGKSLRLDVAWPTPRRRPW